MRKVQAVAFLITCIFSLQITRLGCIVSLVRQKRSSAFEHCMSAAMAQSGWVHALYIPCT
jgi:hypothetical protein